MNRVLIFWPYDKVWYYARVLSYQHGLFTVKYSDNEEEQIDLVKE